VTLKVPRLRKLPFETQIIERYRRRESSVEEALVEMYLAGVSVRRVEDITEMLWGTRASASLVSDMNQKVYARIDEWRNRLIPCVRSSARNAFFARVRAATHRCRCSIRLRHARVSTDGTCTAGTSSR